ncbi:MAG: hypothetical protein K2X77_27630 [Candidatus Obscuribacterales bacterium]|nr:hypothetical protein [Candidatus Obscuribacterales bacterium]
MTSRARFSKRTVLVLALSLGQSLSLPMLPAFAADGAIRISGQTVFENKVAAGGMSVEQRAETIQKNLDNALVATKDRSPSAVSIVYVKGIPVITLGGYQVCTVDADNARLAGTTPAVLAQKWADSLKKALADQSSVNSYIAQITGAYQAAPTTAPAPEQVAYNPPQTVTRDVPQQPQYGGPPPNYGGAYNNNVQPVQYGGYANDQYNRQTGPGGYGGPPQQGYGAPQQGGYGGYPPQGQMQRGRVAYAPAGLVMSATLNTSIATQAAQPGDLIQATIGQSVLLGDAQIPPGSVLVGAVTEAKKGGFLGRAGTLGVKFNRLRTPDGVETPITAHIEGGVGKYDDKNGNDVFRGETWKTKVGQGVIRGGIGAGAGAALGTAVGAIAGGGRGAGRGAWSGTAIGAGVGVVDSLVLRKGKDVVIPSGQQIQIQLDAPVSISVGGPAPYTGAF